MQPPESPRKRYQSPDDVPKGPLGCLLIVLGIAAISLVLFLLDKAL